MWNFLKDNWRNGIEILILAIAIYQVYRAFRATRGAQILVGLGIVGVVLTLVSSVANFTVISWLVTRAAPLLALALVVIFQPELRDALARLGSRNFLTYYSKRRSAFIECLADAVILLSKKRIGALFAIERGINLKKYLETGVVLDARFTSELAHTVFHPKTPLHDGGMILADDRVAGAACVFPVSQREMQDRSIGLRHRAAMGLADETDAVVVVVSEETGAVSICTQGRFERGLTEKQFRDSLARLLLTGQTSNETETVEKMDGKAPFAAGGGSDLVPD
ncbi:MAG: diadenylate cyclase CdaA [Akkermansiaceae bacterium]|nr:diadenylate cyclase CdaA [Akkermansiaceae bacterium]MCF7732180.1 diadenylate cyclase CdaA [Akkermansiaceae bacterium]